VCVAAVEVDEVSTLTRVTVLSSKLRQRMYQRAMRDIKGLKIRSQEKIEKLNFTVDLVSFICNITTKTYCGSLANCWCFKIKKE